MKASISISLDITPEEILALAEGIEKMEQEKIKTRSATSPQYAPPSPVSSQESWAGKTVKIKIETPDSEINSWCGSLGRDVDYGVAEDDGRQIRIQGNWFRKIWFMKV